MIDDYGFLIGSICAAARRGESKDFVHSMKFPPKGLRGTDVHGRAVTKGIDPEGAFV